MKHDMFYIHEVPPQLSKHVEKKISGILPDVFALHFDGWACGQTHYLAVFAFYPSKSKREYDVRLLTFSPMGDDSR